MGQGPGTGSEGVAQGRLLRVWNRWSRYPGGRWLVSRLVGWKAPFTGVLRPSVLELAPGRSKLSVRERRTLRQHLRSLHAGALFTLAETASGLAMMAALPDDARAIVVGASMEFLKKARGTVTAEGECAVPDPREHGEHQVSVVLKDGTGTLVMRATVRWLVGPGKRRGS